MAPRVTSSRDRSRGRANRPVTTSRGRGNRQGASNASVTQGTNGRPQYPNRNNASNRVTNDRQRPVNGNSRVTRGAGARPELPPAGGTTGNSSRARNQAAWGRDRGARAQLGRTLETLTRGAARGLGLDRYSQAQNRINRAAQGTRGQETRVGRPSPGGPLANRPPGGAAQGPQGLPSMPRGTRPRLGNGIQPVSVREVPNRQLPPGRQGGALANRPPGGNALANRPPGGGGGGRPQGGGGRPQLPGSNSRGRLPGGIGGADQVTGGGVRTGRPGANRPQLPQGGGGGRPQGGGGGRPQGGAAANAASRAVRGLRGAGGALGRLSTLLAIPFAAADVIEGINPNSSTNRRLQEIAAERARRRAEARITRERFDPNGPTADTRGVRGAVNRGRQGPELPTRIALAQPAPGRRPSSSNPPASSRPSSNPPASSRPSSNPPASSRPSGSYSPPTPTQSRPQAPVSASRPSPAPQERPQSAPAASPAPTTPTRPQSAPAASPGGQSGRSMTDWERANNPGRGTSSTNNPLLRNDPYLMGKMKQREGAAATESGSATTPLAIQRDGRAPKTGSGSSYLKSKTEKRKKARQD